MALGRNGRRREALILLWEVLVSNVVSADDIGAIDADGKGERSSSKKEPPQNVWNELHSRIVSLSDATDLVNDYSSSKSNNSNNGLNIRLLDAVERLDLRAYAPIELPKKETSPAAATGGGTVTAAAAVGNRAPTKSTSGKGKNAKGGKNVKSKKGAVSGSVASSASSVSYPPVTDDTVLQTLSVTLRAEGMYDTMSEMYFQASEELAANKAASSPAYTRINEENYKHVLEEGVCVHFRAVCDCNSVGKLDVDDDDGKEKQDTGAELQTQLPRLRTLLDLTKYYDRLQTCESHWV